jgi:hypothetical protein
MALVVVGWSSASAAVLPSPEELPAVMVAVVSNVRVRAGRITRAEFQHALVLSAAQAGLNSAPRRGTNAYERMKEDAVGFLLEATWIQGQAAEMSIAVSHREVSGGVAFIKRQNFKNEADYLRFLRESHYTKRDVNERVELQLLASRMQMRLQTRIEREARNEFEEKQAFREFVAEFNERWKARTVCAPEYAIDRCSNGSPSPGSA